MSNRIPPHVGDRVEIIGGLGSGLMGGRRGEIIEVCKEYVEVDEPYEGNEAQVIVRVVPGLPGTWPGGEDYVIYARDLYLIHRP